MKKQFLLFLVISLLCFSVVHAECYDKDYDGYLAEECGGNDCDDNNKQVHPGSTEICNNRDENCNGNIDENCRENIIIITPDQDQDFNSRSVHVELDIVHWDQNVLYKTSDKTRWGTFCSNCLLKRGICEKDVYVPEGASEVQFKVVDHFGIEYTETLSLFADARKPVISRQIPLKYGDSVFTAKYTENYPEVLNLYVKGPDEEDYSLVASKENCEGGRNMECTIHYDTSAFEGQSIKYYFELWDKFEAAKKRGAKITVDNTAPVITVGDIEQLSDNRFNVEIDVNEKAKLTYTYPGSSREKSICSSCSNSRRTFLFRDVPDYVDIKAVDPAGNTATKRVNL